MRARGGRGSSAFVRLLDCAGDSCFVSSVDRDLAFELGCCACVRVSPLSPRARRRSSPSAIALLSPPRPDAAPARDAASPPAVLRPVGHDPVHPLLGARAPARPLVLVLLGSQLSANTTAPSRSDNPSLPLELARVPPVCARRARWCRVACVAGRRARTGCVRLVSLPRWSRRLGLPARSRGYCPALLFCSCSAEAGRQASLRSSGSAEASRAKGRVAGLTSSPSRLAALPRPRPSPRPFAARRLTRPPKLRPLRPPAPPRLDPQPARRPSSSPRSPPSRANAHLQLPACRTCPTRSTPRSGPTSPLSSASPSPSSSAGTSSSPSSRAPPPRQAPPRPALSTSITPSRASQH